MKEIPEDHFGNFSTHRTAGDLRHLDEQRPENEYVDENEGIHFSVEKNPKEQMIISQLASLTMPVSIVFKKDMPEEKIMYFSPDVKNHPNYDKSIRLQKADQAFLYWIFGDRDHGPGWNYDGSVFHDFDHGVVHKNWHNDINDDYPSQYYGPHLKEYRPKTAAELLEKIKAFEKEIEGKQGLEFISSLTKKAEYTEVSPERIQEILLWRCERAKTVLAA